MSDRLDDTAALVRALGVDHEIELFDEGRAHDFVRMDFRAPFDLCVFELANTPQHDFVWPYLLHVPGVLRLRNLSLHEGRTELLRRSHRERDRALELALAGWELTAAPVLSSRMTVVSDADAAARLQRVHPTACFRVAPIGLGSDPGDGSSPGSDPLNRSTQPLESGHEGGLTPIVGSVGKGVVHRAIARARDAGARLELITGPPELILDRADVVIDANWPPADELNLALAGMAAGRPVIVLETESTAGWPALDPQTWLPRGWTAEPPIVVSIDLRDEEHSMSLALRRLANDAPLRHSLGAAAHEWWRHHATLDHAVTAWRSILAEAVMLPPPARPADWPRHLNADGTERAREVLAEFGATVDFV